MKTSQLTEVALLARINRKLRKESQSLRLCREGSKYFYELGRYYGTDDIRNAVVRPMWTSNSSAAKSASCRSLNPSECDSFAMIDIAVEQLLSVAEARNLLPGTKPNTRIGTATLTRWIKSGQLESIKLGGRRYTSLEALQRFASREKFIATITASDPPPTRRMEAAAQRVSSRLSRFNNAA